MKFTPLPPILAPVLLAGVMSASVHAAEIKKGETVWSKRTETALLAEPKPLAKAAAKVGFAEKLSVIEVSGAWLRVEADKEQAGWIFQGNIALDKPSMAPAAGLTTVAASSTDTVAAARPLAPAAEDFAERHDAGEAKTDIDWLDAEAAKLSPEELVAYMREHKKGEYQE